MPAWGGVSLPLDIISSILGPVLKLCFFVVAVVVCLFLCITLLPGNISSSSSVCV